METLIFIAIIVVTVLLGRYALEEGQRVERKNKLLRNMEEHDKKK